MKFEPEVLSSQQYFPFGMLMQGRQHSANDYDHRYGFNGKEGDDEVKGDDGMQDYGWRMYDPATGRFLSVDPIAREYPELTPYQFASNSPISGVDLDGLEFYHFSAIPHGKGSAITKMQVEYTTPFYVETYFGPVLAANYPLPKAYILNIGSDQFIFGSTGDLFRAAQTINWNHFRETHEVVGELLDPDRTLGAIDKYVESIQEVAALGAGLMGRSPQSAAKGTLSVHKNSNSAFGNFILYLIRSGEKILKFGIGKKGDERADGKNRRMHESEKKAQKEYPDAKGEEIKSFYDVFKGYMKEEESTKAREHREKYGDDELPLNKENDKRYRPKKNK